MTIDNEKLSALAKDLHIKEKRAQELHQQMQKGGTPEQAAEYAIARVERNRAKNLLDLEVREQSITIIPATDKATSGEAHG